MLVLALTGCDDVEAPTQVWTPDDHAHPSTQDVDPARVPRPAEPVGDPTARAAAALWRVSCASCHGVAGHGDGPQAPGPLPDLADTQWQAEITDERIADVIRNGRAPMPAFGETIVDAGIDALVVHVRSLAGP